MSAGATSAGRNVVARNSSVVASALPGAVEDGDGERDGAEAPAQLVEGVGRRQAPEGRDAEGRYAHGMRIDNQVGGLERASVRSDTGRPS